MARRYDAFLVRSWRRGDERRVAVEHRQSGSRLADATLAVAADWIDARRQDPRPAGAASHREPGEHGRRAADWPRNDAN